MKDWTLGQFKLIISFLSHRLTSWNHDCTRKIASQKAQKHKFIQKSIFLERNFDNGLAAVDVPHIV